MYLTDAQISDLRDWMLAKLEEVAEADAEVLADYVFEILRTTPTMEEVRQNYAGELEGFLNENTASFVDELLLKLTPTGPKLKSPNVLLSLTCASMTPASLSNPQTSSPTVRNPLPISQARPALRNAPPISHTPPKFRKRKLNHEYVDDDQNHIGNHRVTKRSRNADVHHGSWRGQGNPAATGANMQPVSLGLGSMPISFPRPPTPPTGMPVFSPTNPAVNFAAMFPYMATMMMNAQSALKKERCQYFDEHGYCMRGDTCPYSHIKQVLDEEARDKTGGYADHTNEAPIGPARRMTGYNHRLPNTSLAKDDELNLSSVRTIYVDHIPPKNFDRAKIMDYFQQFGTIVKVKLSGVSSASVRFSNAAAAARAIESPKAVFESRHIIVTSSNGRKSCYLPEDSEIPTTTEALSASPEEYDEPLTPKEDTEIDTEAVKAEQAIKQQEHRARRAVMKKTENESARLAGLSAEVEAKLEAEKSKLLTLPGGYDILAEISRDQEKKASWKDAKCQLEQTAAEYGVPLDVISVAKSKHGSRCGSSATSDAPPIRGNSEILCKFYPNCTRSSCTFKHQDVGQTSHPGGRQTSQVLCKYLTNCTNPACTFVHPGARHGSKIICKYHPKCTNSACTFKHLHTQKLDVECRYFPNCTNPRCIFKHPENTTGACPGAMKHAENRPKSLLISGVTASIKKMSEGTNMVRVAVMAIEPFESLETQSVHDESAGEEEAHDGLVVTFAQRWQAEEVQKRLTMVGGVGQVKCTWYTGPLDASVTGTLKTELEVKSESDGERSDANGDVSMHDVMVKEEDLDVAGDDAWPGLADIA